MNFCTLEHVEDFLQVAIEDEDKQASVARAIQWATEAIKNFCHQRIELVENDEITLDVMRNDYRVFLPELPVIEVTRVVEDGTLLAVTDDYKLGQYGILYRVDDNWAQGVQILTITYTHGYSQDNLPDDIVAVCARAASRAYQAGLRAAEEDGVPGVASKSLGDYAVSYMAEGGGGVSEGVMGASAARLLLLSEKDMLSRYRYVAQ